jgi:hypothetical protein
MRTRAIDDAGKEDEYSVEDVQCVQGSYIENIAFQTHFLKFN